MGIRQLHALFIGSINAHTGIGIATLFGLVMLSHQSGGFLGAWLGGKTFEAIGSYDLDVVRRHRARCRDSAYPPANSRKTACKPTRRGQIGITRENGCRIRLVCKTATTRSRHES